MPELGVEASSAVRNEFMMTVTVRLWHRPVFGRRYTTVFVPQDDRRGLGAGSDATAIDLGKNGKQFGTKLTEVNPVTVQSTRAVAFRIQRAVPSWDEFPFGSPHHVELGVGERLHHRCGDAIASASVSTVKAGDVFPAVAGVFDVMQRFLENVCPLVAHVVFLTSSGPLMIRSRPG